MKIVIFNPKSDFLKEQQITLTNIGKVSFVDEYKEYPLNQLIEIAKDAEIIAVNPDILGGFEKAKNRLVTIMETLPRLKGIAFGTTSYGWVDLDYCRKRKIVVCSLPAKLQSETIAEQTIALLLCASKQIILTDRRTQKGQYKLEMGFELKGKTLGIIGLGNIGSRVAEIAKCFGMRVIACNRSPKSQNSVEMKTLGEILRESDAISIHATHVNENKGLISKKEIHKIKKGAIIINIADREMVDEEAMAEAIRSKKVATYIYEAEDLINTPLADLENAIGLQGFGWYTSEVMTALMETWVENIVALAKNKSKNMVEL